MYYPINKQNRATGFLMPSYGSSSVQGFTLNDAFFWAVDRSQDATFYHDWYSKTGQGLGGEYRYAASPGSQGNARVYMLNERTQFAPDGTTVTKAAHRSFDVRSNVNQGLPGGFRVIGNVNYFTDLATQQLYQQNIFNLSQRSRTWGATVTGGAGRYHVSGTYGQTEVYYGTTKATKYGTAPYVNFSVGEKTIGHSPVYLSANVAAGYLVRQDDIHNPLTNRSLFRIDGAPTISVPVSSLPALTVTASASWRYTYWTQSLDPVSGAQVKTPLSRNLFSLQTRVVGPVFSRIWHTPGNGYAEGFKHVIEPSVTIQHLSSFKATNQVVKLDGVDTVVPSVTQVNYSLTNRLLAKRRPPGPPPAPTTPGAPAVQAPGVIREILTVSLSQTYYTDALAAAYDAQYQSSFNDLSNAVAPPSPFSPVQLAVTARPTETTTAQFQMEYDTKFNAVRTYSASANVNQRLAVITAGWSKRQVIPGLQGFSSPSHYLNASVNLRQPDNKYGGTFTFYYDVVQKYFLQRRLQLYYRSQCCGVSFNYETVDLSHFSVSGVPSNRRVTLSFTLAGLGTFAPPMGGFGSASRP